MSRNQSFKVSSSRSPPTSVVWTYSSIAAVRPAGVQLWTAPSAPYIRSGPDNTQNEPGWPEASGRLAARGVLQVFSRCAPAPGVLQVSGREESRQVLSHGQRAEESRSSSSRTLPRCCNTEHTANLEHTAIRQDCERCASI